MGALRLVHYSGTELTTVESRQQDPDGAMKPNGLWISVEGNGDGWHDWCIGEDYNIDELAIAHEITLTDDARILHIQTTEEIDDLTRTHDLPLPPTTLDLSGYRLDWARIARTYQGIIIAPYVWPRRLALHTGWYYGWDCASGCIWDASAIAKITCA